MANWFQWKGERSTLIKYGLYVVSHPSIIIPDERLRHVEVPGRSGTLTQFEGDGVYNDYIASVECLIRSPATIPAVAAWLKGSGEVIFGNQPDVFYKARVANQIELAQVMRGRPHRTCIVNFRCEPYRYLPSGNTQQTVSANNSAITNPGTASSEPLIRVNGTGDVTLMIRGQIIALFAVNSYITLDTALKEPHISTGH